MFSALLAKLGGVFSPSFWVGNYMPVLIAAAANAAMVRWIDPHSTLFAFFDGDDKLAHAAAAAFGVFLLAYMLGPLTPLVTGLMDGSLLPAWLRDLLSIRYRQLAVVAKAEISDHLRVVRAFARFKTQEVPRLQQARLAGEALGHLNSPQAIDAARLAIEAAETAAGTSVPSPAEAQEAIAQLQNALVNNAAALPLGHPDAALAAELDRLHRRLAVDLLPGWATEAQRDLDRAVAGWNRRVAINTPGPTRFGNMRTRAEAYPQTVYNVDFDYLWPRLRLQLGAEPDKLDALTSARVQIEFSALLLALLAASWAGWLLALAFWRIAEITFLMLAIGGPLVLALLYQFAVESEIAFGAVIKASIDRNRLDVLKTLKQPRPYTLSAERALWWALQRAEQAPQRNDLIYRYD